MDFKGLSIGFGVTGSFCTLEKIKKEMHLLTGLGADITPVFSYNIQQYDTRFGSAQKNLSDIENIAGRNGFYTITESEQVGPKKLFDIMLIAPCTGNTLAKLANGITDTPVLMAAKAHLRNSRPLVLSIATNDALGINFKNIGTLMNMKNIYFVPFGQDDSLNKPNSMIADTKLIPATLEAALTGIQYQPVISGS